MNSDQLLSHDVNFFVWIPNIMVLICTISLQFCRACWQNFDPMTDCLIRINFHSLMQSMNLVIWFYWSNILHLQVVIIL